MRHINFLIKPASSLCNLRCRYCFYEDEANNRAQKSLGIMPEATVDALLLRAFTAIEPGGEISFAFQGGEPTVAGLAWFRAFVEKAEAQTPPRVSVQYAIQTNGTLLDDEWASFLAEKHFLVGLSMDGEKALHNLYRKDAVGEDTWNRVQKSLALLQKHGADYNALCVVTGQAAKHPERVYRELKRLGFRYLQFIACLDPIGEPRGQRPWSLSPAAYGDFLCRLFDLWYADWKAGDYHSVRLFDDYIHILLGDGASTCATCGKCGSYFVVEADGSVYPCDFFALDDWRLGSITEMSLADLANTDRAKAFIAVGRQKPQECAACRYSRVCNGGCPNDRTRNDPAPHNYYCASFKKLLDYAMPRMQEIARAEYALRQRMGR